MAVKIAVTPKYEDEKRQIHSNRLLLYLLLKKLTALSDIFFLTFGSYAPDCKQCTLSLIWVNTVCRSTDSKTI